MVFFRVELCKQKRSVYVFCHINMKIVSCTVTFDTNFFPTHFLHVFKKNNIYIPYVREHICKGNKSAIEAIRNIYLVYREEILNERMRRR